MVVTNGLRDTGSPGLPEEVQAARLGEILRLGCSDNTRPKYTGKK